jgi:NitT/TauT family transport system substrate-binding protein
MTAGATPDDRPPEPVALRSALVPGASTGASLAAERHAGGAARGTACRNAESPERVAPISGGSIPFDAGSAVAAAGVQPPRSSASAELAIIRPSRADPLPARSKGRRMFRTATRAVAALALTALAPLALAQALDRLVFATDWLAQAEHGGFYQAVAEGIYRKHGLDVTIRQGGPQVNGLQLLAANQLDVAMGDGLQALSAVEQGVPVVAIAATFQKNPTVLIAHPGVRRIEDLKGRPIAIGAPSNTTFWPWLRQQYGFADDQKRPYGFSVQPFLADKALAQQGFATSEPFSIEQAGVSPVVFLLADLGYPPYSEALIVTRATLAKRGDVLRRFVRASAEGWKSYLANPAPGNALIRKDNPQMGEALLAYGVRKLREYAIVEGGDARTQGLLTMTTARWQASVDFLRNAGLAKANVDYTQAWTLDIVKDVRVLP